VRRPSPRRIRVCFTLAVMGTDDNNTEPDPRLDDTQVLAGTRTASRPPRAPLHERYRVLETLGKGGMGEVIAAHDEVLGRDVAIKRMLESDQPGAITRFLREAKIQGMLNHSAIPPVHELAHDADGRPFFVMKRLTGITLGKILSDQAAGLGLRYPMQRLLNAFADVCLAVELAHTRGIVHRDLKPSNIMLGEFGEVYVLDWGVAKIVGMSDPATTPLRDSSPGVVATQAGAIVGTEGYMSPEQRSGVELDGRADVYSLGCVLYEILTGKRFDQSVRAAQKTPDRDVPPELDDACAAATLQDRDMRLGSARELALRVERYLDGDRDLGMRQRLAAEHLARAIAAAATSDDESQRVAMREAGRALALDPTLAGAADLVSRLMLEPPRTMPVEVAETIAAADRVANRRHARIAGIAYLGYTTFIPFLAWIGVREWTPIAVYGAIILALVVAAAFRVRYPDHIAPAVATVIGNAAMIGWIGRMFSPYLIAPGLGAMTIVIMNGSSQFRSRSLLLLMIVGMAIGTAGSGLLEFAGGLHQTLTFADDHIRIRSGVLVLNETPLQLGLALYAFGLVLAAAVLSHTLGRANDDSQRRLHLQAWRLRQLVPQSA
jgi:eukaryotic-like serine/threonine-protein kinase